MDNCPPQAARDNRVAAVDAHIQYFFRKSEVDRINKLDSEGFAPIHYAAKFNRYDIMRKLVDGGPNLFDEEDEDDSKIGKSAGLAHCPLVGESTFRTNHF